MAKLSIAMTTYNGEKYVEKQLLSLLNQTRKADEVIIRDDCSADRTAEIVNRFIRENSLDHWAFTVNQKNLGYKRNFYKAISQTTGDIIFLCDQDDSWLPEKLATIEKIMEEHPEIQALSSSFEVINQEDQIFGISQYSKEANQGLIRFKIQDDQLKGIKLNTIFIQNISPDCTTAFTKQVKEIYLQKTHFELPHDWELNFIAACLKGLYFYNRPLIQYRIHSNNTIGLDALMQRSGFRTNLDYHERLSRADKLYDAMNSFVPFVEIMSLETKKQFEVQKEFTEDRLNAIIQKNVWKILRLYRYRRNYCESITWKGRIADIICVVLPNGKKELS